MGKWHYTYSDIVHALKSVGLEHGDIVFTHSNLGFCGILETCSSAHDLCEQFRRAFMEILGGEGTLIVPTFTYSFCRNEIFDIRNTPSGMGIFPEYIRRYPGSLRSDDANFSVCALGVKGAELTSHMPQMSFGTDSFWERFYMLNGKVCNINFDAGSTFIHYIEKSLAVPYRYDKGFDGTFIDHQGLSSSRRYYHFVYDLDKPQDSYSSIRLHELCQEHGILRSSNLGKGRIVCQSTHNLYPFVEDTLKARPRFLTQLE
ncbi:MAG: AAC(3) family N-acetyltransferase [Peptococcaceae bacterium]|nr:AAC(3) family N-acetyltransferase [Peptococcaceae bacterium]